MNIISVFEGTLEQYGYKLINTLFTFLDGKGLLLKKNVNFIVNIHILKYIYNNNNQSLGISLDE